MRREKTLKPTYEPKQLVQFRLLPTSDNWFDGTVADSNSRFVTVIQDGAIVLHLAYNQVRPYVSEKAVASDVTDNTYDASPSSDPAQSFSKLANTPQAKLTGGDVNYYLVEVRHPKRLEPYIMEVGDIIEALNMTFDEGTVFKTLIRNANMRKGLGKPSNTAEYDAEKMVYSSQRVLAKIRNDKLDAEEAARLLEKEPS